MKENGDKRHETVKDFVSRTKDELVAKVEMAMNYNDKIKAVMEDMTQLKELNAKFTEDMTKDYHSVKEKLTSFQREMWDFQTK